MKKIFIAALGCVPLYVHAMLVQLPSEEVMRQKLEVQENMVYFLEHTNVVHELAGQKKSVENMLLTVEHCIADYEEHASPVNPFIAGDMHDNMFNLVDLFLQGIEVLE